MDPWITLIIKSGITMLLLVAYGTIHHLSIIKVQKQSGKKSIFPARVFVIAFAIGFFEHGFIWRQACNP